MRGGIQKGGVYPFDDCDRTGLSLGCGPGRLTRHPKWKGANQAADTEGQERSEDQGPLQTRIAYNARNQAPQGADTYTFTFIVTDKSRPLGGEDGD